MAIWFYWRNLPLWFGTTLCVFTLWLIRIIMVNLGMHIGPTRGLSISTTSALDSTGVCYYSDEC